MAKKKSKKKVKKTKKLKEPNFDGLSAKDKRNIRTALRRVWSWSYPHRLVRTRCLSEDGFSRCEACSAICPKVYVDHIARVGEVDSGIIDRMFIPSTKLQGLCKKCHDQKTKEERKAANCI